MANEVITDHPNIGKTVSYEDGRGTITGYKTKSQMVMQHTDDGLNIKSETHVLVRVKPDDGGKAFWMGPFMETDPIYSSVNDSK